MVNRKRFLNILLVFIALILVLTPMTSASAQTYRFTLPVYEVEAYIEEDGSVTLYYYMEFLNDSAASPLDFVDLALPYANYDLRNIEATINDNPMPEVNDSAYVNGAELALNNTPFQPVNPARLSPRSEGSPTFSSHTIRTIGKTMLISRLSQTILDRNMTVPATPHIE